MTNEKVREEIEAIADYLSCNKKELVIEVTALINKILEELPDYDSVDWNEGLCYNIEDVI